MAEDLGNAVPRRNVITINGESYIIDGYGFGDRQLMFSEFMKIKRRRIMQPIVDIRDSLPEDVWQEQMNIARKEAGEIEDVTSEEVTAYISSEEGLSTLLFCLIDRRYPGKVSKAKLVEMLVKKELSEDELINICESIGDALGGSEKNSSRGPMTPSTS